MKREGQRWWKIRWITVAAYTCSVGLLVLSMFIFPEEEESLGLAMGVVTIFGLVPLFYILNLPYMKWKKEKIIPDTKVIEDVSRIREPGNKHIIDHVPIHFILGLFIFIILIISIGPYFYPIINGESVSLEMTIYTFVTVGFIGLIGALFWRLEIEVNEEFMRFHWGPFGKKVPLEDIETIRPVIIRPLRDYMGYGIRSGPDGAVGYISHSKVGVRLQIKGGRTYVVSTHNPDEICDLVKWARKRARLK